MASRRGFLGMIAASPLVARSAAQSQIGEMSKITLGVGNGMSNALNAGYGQASIGTPKLPDFASLFANPLFKEQYESLLFEECRSVTSIDPDIACMRSFSFSAKIAYQRQRNVERRIGDMKGKNVWARVHDFMDKWAQS